MRSGGWAKYVRHHGSPIKGKHKATCLGCGQVIFVPSINAGSWEMVKDRWYCGQAKPECRTPASEFISGLDLQLHQRFIPTYPTFIYQDGKLIGIKHQDGRLTTIAP